MNKKNNLGFKIIILVLILIFATLTYYYMTTTFWNKEITITDNELSLNMNTTINFYQHNQNNNKQNILKCEKVCMNIFRLDHDPGEVICTGHFCHRDCYKYCSEEFLKNEEIIK